MTEFGFTVAEENEGERLDKLLASLMPDFSRSFLQKLFDDSVDVSGKRVKPGYRVRENDEVHVLVPETAVPDILPEDIPLDILYEDEDVLVVNKPKGMVVHPAPGHYSGTLVNAVLYHCRGSLSGINGVLRPGIVHRIDKDTTGSLIVCKNDFSHKAIAEQLAGHTMTRRYVAIACGSVGRNADRTLSDEITIDAPIGRDKFDRKKMAVMTDPLAGKRAVTHCRVLDRYRDYTEVECVLETGRTHQIRVHLASAGHPLLGDEVYGGGRKWPWHLQGQCLHAMTLGFIHPRTGEYIETTAPLPDYFTHLLEVMPR